MKGHSKIEILNEERTQRIYNELHKSVLIFCVNNSHDLREDFQKVNDDDDDVESFMIIILVG